MSEHTIETPLVKRLERSNSEKVFAGVCGGLGRYFDLAPAIFRLGFVVLTLLGGAGLLVYIAAVLVMPKEGEDSSVAEDVLKKRRDHPVRLVALGLIAVAILSLLARASTWPSAGFAWFLVVAAGVVLLWTSSRRPGVVLAITTFLTLVVVAILTAVIVAFAWFDVSLRDGVGDRTYAPTAIQQVHNRYDLGIGQLTVDLSQLPSSQPVHVKAHLGIGELRVIVPRNASVVLDTRVKAGDRTVESLSGGTQGPFYVDAKVGAGHIDVERAS
ncbi:MAG TPA: PspC domain-containing protein [Gaiellaceae bacterium]|nr:PspC domain-containing protein [Gaiellaceae bacterium]